MFEYTTRTSPTIMLLTGITLICKLLLRALPFRDNSGAYYSKTGGVGYTVSP